MYTYVRTLASTLCYLSNAHKSILHEQADRRFPSTRKIKMVERGVGRTEAAPLGGSFLQYTAWEKTRGDDIFDRPMTSPNC